MATVLNGSAVAEAVERAAARMPGTRPPVRPTFGVVTITPTIAERLLNANKRNRPLSGATVERYARDMAQGRWQLTPQPVAFDWEGNLLDGQHRLYAVIESNTAIESSVGCDFDPDAFKAIDRGKKRSIADNFALIGEKQAVALAAAVTKFNQYSRGVLWHRDTVNVDEALETLDEHPGLRDSARKAIDWKIKGVGFPAAPSLMAVLHYLFVDNDLALADWFFESLASGVGLLETDAVFHLRNRLIGNKTNAAKLSDKVVTALIIKAWNAHRQGKPVRVLRWTENEQFPEIQ